MRSRSGLLLLASTLAASANLHAGHPDSSQNEISDVLVTAPSTHVSGGHLIGADEIKAKSAATSDTGTLLNLTPGVSLYGAGGVSSLPSIHGLGDDRLRIKVKGMDLVSACGNHMNPPLSYIDPTALESIAVFAGITPVSMGGDSIGGTIVAESAPPEFSTGPGLEFMSGVIGGFYRSNGDGRGVNLSANAASDTVNLRYSGAFAKSDNYSAGKTFKASGSAAPGRGTLAGDEVGSTAYETQNHSLGLAVRRHNHLFDLELGYQHIPYQGFPNQRMDMLENTSRQWRLSHEADYQWGKVESRVYHENTRHKMNFGPDKQFWYMDAPGMPMETEGKNTGLSVTVEYALADTQLLRLGGEFQYYDLDDWWPPSGSGMMMSPNTFWNINNGERDRNGLFGEWQANWSQHWQTNLGIRYEHVEMNSGEVQGYSMMYSPEAVAFNNSERAKTDDNWDFTAQAQYSPSSTSTYKFGVARKTRSPNLYERYTWSTVGMAMRMINLAGDGNGYVGNLALEPEIAHTLSLSADWHDATGEHWQLVITPYYTLVDDYVDAATCTTMMCNSANVQPGFRYLQFTNDDARLYGVDISGFRHLMDMENLGNLSLHGVINYVDGKNRTTGDNLYNIMPLNGTLSLKQTAGRWSNSIEWQLVSAKDHTSAVRNEVATSGYGLVNLRSELRILGLTLNIGVENLLDKGYDLPLGGAYTGQGQTMSATGVPWGVPVPGPGRSVYAGLNYSF